MLGAQRAQAHSQLVGMVLVLAGLLANAVEAFAQGIATGHQLLTLLGVLGHQVQGLLQHQARLTQLLVLQSTLLLQLGQLFLQTAATQFDLLGAGAACRQAGLELAMLAPLFLGTPAQLLALFFQAQLLFAQTLKLLLKVLQGGFLLQLLLAQALDLLATGQHAAFGLAASADPQKMPANPITVPADQALPLAQARTQRQRLGQVIDRFHLPQPGRQVDAPFDFVQQAARQPRALAACQQQPQLALFQIGKIEAAEIIDQYGLQISAQHRLHCQLPARLDPKPFSQARSLCQALPMQPVCGTYARLQRGLLQGLKRGQPPAQTLQVALCLLLRLSGLLQLLAGAVEPLDHLLFGQLQLFQQHFAAGQLLGQLKHGGVLRLGSQQVALFTQLALTLRQPLQAGFQLLQPRLLHFSLTTRFGGPGVEAVPLLLPAVHA
ncbi:hypothetical protein D3C81_1017950 [compost metagenome]